MAIDFLKNLFGSKQEHDLKALVPLLHKVNEKENWAISLQDSDFPAETARLKEKYRKSKDLESLLPEAFALSREAARRVLGERHYDVQILGAIVLHQGKIMEMKTGEGKTLSCVPAAFLNALTGEGVHIITVNEYLAERDAAWMGPVYNFLGLSVGVIVSELDNERRKAAYSKDITYGTNNEFGFDYLRDNMKVDISQKIQPKHTYSIIDEIDSILIDEARTPLIISGAAEDDTKKFEEVNRLVNSLNEASKDPETGKYPELPEGDFTLDEKSKKVSFTNEGMNKIEALLQKQKIIDGSLFNDENFEYIHYFTQAVKAHKLFKKDTDYVVKDGLVQIVDEFTGRILHGRRYSDGLHQAIEAKERIKVAKRNRTLATITFQNFFRMYDKISGMTGTADTEATEFSKIYGLEVVVIPTNRPVIRLDEDDFIYYNEDFKFKAICDEIEQVNKKGQPILVGTVTIDKSEMLSAHLKNRGIRHEVLNAKNHAREAHIIAEAGAKGSVTIATNMAGRGTDIKLGGNPEFRARSKAGTEASEEEFQKVYADERVKWESQYKEVKELGGLYILGTERHESRRIDNQLRGRSGRQGDPGLSKFFLSLDDTLLRLFAKDNLKEFMGKLGLNSGEPIKHQMISRAIEKSQSKVEERNFEIRKHLLDFDDVLNEQRNFIYSRRDEILQDTQLKDRVMQTADELVHSILEEAYSSNKSPEQLQKVILENLTEQFHMDFSSLNLDCRQNKKEELKKQIISFLNSNLEEKINMAGEKVFNSFIRYQYIRQIDKRWQDHLENMEALREAVYLRSYSQKNPLLEYKLEGFDIFDEMLQDIRYSIGRVAIRVKISQDHQKRQPYSSRRVQEQHAGMGQFGPARQASNTAGISHSANSSQQAIQIKRNTPKVGRNDPCPCGSGKKYKHCCGR
ncbi:MAG: preprotein translocase subunit SecA [Spirochaetia bacterium]|nr:preprotein translocase subunit SecA [Spirochaetia bacterium]